MNDESYVVLGIGCMKYCLQQRYCFRDLKGWAVRCQINLDKRRILDIINLASYTRMLHYRIFLDESIHSFILKSIPLDE